MLLPHSRKVLGFNHGPETLSHYSHHWGAVVGGGRTENSLCGSSGCVAVKSGVLDACCVGREEDSMTSDSPRPFVLCAARPVVCLIVVWICLCGKSSLCLLLFNLVLLEEAVCWRNFDFKFPSLLKLGILDLVVLILN